MIIQTQNRIFLEPIWSSVHMSTIIIFIFQHISLRHGGDGDGEFKMTTSIFQFMYVIILTQTQGLLLSVPTPWEICLWNCPIRVCFEKYVGSSRHFFVSIENTICTIFNKILAQFICDTKIYLSERKFYCTKIRIDILWGMLFLEL